MSLRIHDTAPDFPASTTDGVVDDFPTWISDSGAIPCLRIVKQPG